MWIGRSALGEAIAEALNIAESAIVNKIRRRAELLHTATQNYLHDSVVKLSYELEDRANERQSVTMRELARVRALVETADRKLDKLLEHEARARNEQKVVRKELRGTGAGKHVHHFEPAEDRDVLVCTSCPEERPRLRLRPSSTVTGLSEAARRRDGAAPERVLAGEKVDVVPRVPNEKSEKVIEDVAKQDPSDGLSPKQAAELTGKSYAHVVAAANDGLIRGAVKVPGRGHGRWVLPLAGVEAWAKS